MYHLSAHLYDLHRVRGEVYQRMGDWNQAIADYREGIGYAKQLSYWRGISETGGLLAEAYAHVEAFQQALATISEAIAADREIPDELYFVPRNLGIKAEILAKMGRVRASNDLYEKSADLLDALLSRVPTPMVERQLLTELHTSHLGFFHTTAPRASSRAALSATYLADETQYGKRWIFQDVHSGGAGALAGIEPGNILLRVDGREIAPPEHPVFSMGKQTTVELAANDDRLQMLTVDVARPKGKKLHFIEPTVVEAKRLGDLSVHQPLQQLPIAIAGIGGDGLRTLALPLREPSDHLLSSSGFLAEASTGRLHADDDAAVIVDEVVVVVAHPRWRTALGCICRVRIRGGHLILAVRRLHDWVLRIQFSEPLANRSIHLRGFRQLLSRDATFLRGIRLNERSIYR